MECGELSPLSTAWPVTPPETATHGRFHGGEPERRPQSADSGGPNASAAGDVTTVTKPPLHLHLELP